MKSLILSLAVLFSISSFANDRAVDALNDNIEQINKELPWTIKPNRVFKNYRPSTVRKHLRKIRQNCMIAKENASERITKRLMVLCIKKMNEEIEYSRSFTEYRKHSFRLILKHTKRLNRLARNLEESVLLD